MICNIDSKYIQFPQKLKCFEMKIERESRLNHDMQEKKRNSTIKKEKE